MLRSQMLRSYLLGHDGLLMARNCFMEHCMEKMEEKGHSCLIRKLGFMLGINGST